MISSHRHPQRRQGFTLVELLVTIAIIAVLATISFMVARRAIDGASKAKTISNLRQLVSTSQLFSADNNGAVLDWSKTTVNGRTTGWAYHLLITLSPELATNDAYKSSAGDITARSIGVFGDSKALKKGAPSLQKTGHNSWRTFAYNNRIGTYTPESPEPIPYKQGVKYIHQIEAPSKLILFSQRILDGSQYFAFLQPEDANNSKIYFDLYSGKAPIAFYDGHVELYAKKYFPSAVGTSIDQGTNKPLTQDQWRQHWWGRSTETPPL